jgi:hypothetical protein
MQSVELEKNEKIEPPQRRGGLARLSSSTAGISRYLVRISSVLYSVNRNDRGTPSLDKGVAPFRTRKRPSRFRCFPSQFATTIDHSQEKLLFSCTASITPLTPMLRSTGRHLRQIYPESSYGPSGRSSARYGSLHTNFIFKSVECGLSVLPGLLQ